MVKVNLKVLIGDVEALMGNSKALKGDGETLQSDKAAQGGVKGRRRCTKKWV